MGYRYEMHLHTREGSACAKSSITEQLQVYHALGYAGVCITDHFYKGNTSVPRQLPWDMWVTQFYKSYEMGRELAEQWDMDLFWGWEYSYHGNDFLIYGLGMDWLLAHPEPSDLSLQAYLRQVRSDGGYVVHAHPFREASYIDYIRLLPRDVDGVEIWNAEQPDFVNRLAAQYAENYGLPAFAGSDNHSGRQKKLAGICAPIRYKEVSALLRDTAKYPEWLFYEPFPDAFCGCT